MHPSTHGRGVLNLPHVEILEARVVAKLLVVSPVIPMIPIPMTCACTCVRMCMHLPIISCTHLVFHVSALPHQKVFNASAFNGVSHALPRSKLPPSHHQDCCSMKVAWNLGEPLQEKKIPDPPTPASKREHAKKTSEALSTPGNPRQLLTIRSSPHDVTGPNEGLATLATFRKVNILIDMVQPNPPPRPHPQTGSF